MWWSLLACMDFAPSPGLAPTAEHVPTERPELEPLRGRWVSVAKGEDGSWAVAAACPGAEPPFVEIRNDPVTGWELMSGGADGLRILAISGAEQRPDGVRIAVTDEEPVDLQWVEPDRIARFAGLSADRVFAAPAARSSLPAQPATACP